MLPARRTTTHPGQILFKEFLEPMHVSRTAFARHIGLPPAAVIDLVRGRRSVDADLAWRLAGALGTTPQLWMNLQSNHDLSAVKVRRRVRRLRRSA